MANENKKPETMLEALEDAGARIDKKIVNLFREVVGKNTCEMSIGAQVRMLHFALIRALHESSVNVVFQPALGIIAKCLLPQLTDEEKEALRNDKLSGLL